MNCLCKRPTIIADSIHGELVCGSCGTVLETNVSEQALETAHLAEGRDDYGVGTLLPQPSSRAHTVAARRNTQGAILSRIFVRQRQMLESIGVGATIQYEAYSLCRKLVHSGFATGRDKTVVAAASLMLACRLHGRVLEWRDIPGISTKMRRTLKMYREMQYVSGIILDKYTQSIISRLCTDMNLSVYHAQRALSIFDTMQKSNFTHGKKPQCVAAATVVLAGAVISKRKIAIAARISEPGLRNLLSAWQSYK